MTEPDYIIGEPEFLHRLNRTIYGCYDDEVLHTDTYVSCMDCGDNMIDFVSLDKLDGEPGYPDTAIICLNCAGEAKEVSGR